MSANHFVVRESKIESHKAELYTKTFEPKDVAPIGTITFIHGMGEHCSRYDAIFSRFAESGLIVNTFDQRGHGKSSGLRGHSDNYDVTFADITLIAKKADPKLPHIIYGHSMGGGLCLGWSLAESLKKEGAIHINGVVASSPMLRVTHPKPLSVSFAKFTSRIFPTFTAPNGLDVKHLSRDPEEVKKYKEDPLVHNKISTALVKAMFELGERLLVEANQFTLPVLLFHGEKDEITDPKATQIFYDHCASSDKTIRILPELYHETHNELLEDREKVIQMVLDWIVSHCKNATTNNDNNNNSTTITTTATNNNNNNIITDDEPSNQEVVIKESPEEPEDDYSSLSRGEE